MLLAQSAGPDALVHRRFRGCRSARLPTWLDGEYSKVNRASGGQTKGSARSLPSAPVPPRAPATCRTHGPRSTLRNPDHSPDLWSDFERRVDCPQIGFTPRPGNLRATTSAAPMMRG